MVHKRCLRCIYLKTQNRGKERKTERKKERKKKGLDPRSVLSTKTNSEFAPQDKKRVLKILGAVHRLKKTIMWQSHTIA